jgi:hypothetical protein
MSDMLRRATRSFTRAGDSVLTTVRAAWADATGPGTVNHAYPIRRSRAGVVTVACSDAVWAQELGMRADEIAGRLERITGDPDAVRGLRFVVADHAIPQAVEEFRPPPPLPPPAPAAMERAREATRAIDDPELREIVTRAAARALERDEGS